LQSERLCASLALNHRARRPRVPGNAKEMLVSDTSQEVGSKYLKGGHCKGVNVTLLRGVALFEAILHRIQQFGRHITDSPWLGSCRAV